MGVCKNLKPLAATPPNQTAMSDLDRALLGHSDPEKAVQIKTEITEHEFDASPKGQELVRANMDAPYAEAQMKSAKAKVEAQEKQCRGTKPRRKSSPEAGSGRIVPVGRWSGSDQVMAVLLALGAMIALILGVANIYANLMASQIETFENSPSLALLLSFILPISSLALKVVTNFIELDTHRRNYALVIYGATFILLLVWTVLFAMSFASISGSMDWDIDSATSGMPLVLCQILLELFCGAALALGLEDIVLKYSPQTWITNPEYRERQATLNVSRAAFKFAHTQWCEVQTTIQTLEAERTVYIQHRVAAFISHQRRFQAL